MSFLGCTCSKKTRLLIMLCITLSFFLVEIVVGHISNSNALVADAFHMLSDVVALVVAFLSIHYSPKDWSKNTFGFARAEVLGALTNAVFLLALCFTILIDSIKRFVEKEEVDSPKMVLIVGGVGLGCNLVGLAMFGGGHGHSHDGGGHGHSHGGSKSSSGEGGGGKRNSPEQMNIKGVFLHIMADALGSVIVCISAGVIMAFEDWDLKYIVDPCLSIVLVVLIVATTLPLFRDSAYVLLQTIPPHIELPRLRSDLMQEVPEIVDVHEFHVWSLVSTRILASLHVQLDKDVSRDDHMSYAKRIKAFFHDRGIHSTTVQFEYYGDSAGRDLASASPSASDAISTEAPESCMVQCPSIEGGGGGADNNAFVSSINEGASAAGAGEPARGPLRTGGSNSSSSSALMEQRLIAARTSAAGRGGSSRLQRVWRR